jgi:hypothetical protein
MLRHGCGYALQADVILAQNTPMVAVLRQQTTTIPIVFVSVSDPVGDGFVENLARPTAPGWGRRGTRCLRRATLHFSNKP